MLKSISALIASLLFITAFQLSLASGAEPQSVKVFILAGQSNMEGKASNALLEHQAEAAETKKLFAHLRDGDKWIVRDDVFIKYLERHGNLTLGYGSRDKTGVELQFGHVLGNHFQEPVLLIKTAWGGHSLYQKFRSPSAGMPSDEELQNELAKAQQNVQNRNKKNNKSEPLPTMEDIKAPYGSSYRHMMDEVQATLQNIETLFPELKGKKLELTGFVWFQGFNDMFGEAAPVQYEANMKHFIQDVRKDLKSPHLPFVIGALGQNGSKPAQGGMLQIQTAQLAMNDVPEFKGNVITIRTDELADKEAERLFPGWKDHFEEWKLVGSDRPYHYLGSAIWFNRIGNAFGESMIELLKNQK